MSKNTSMSTNTSIPKNTGTAVSDPTVAIGKVLFALIFIVTLIFFLAWLARRIGFANLASNRKMQVLESLALANRERAVLVKIANKHLLLGVAPGRVSTLYEFSKNELEGSEQNREHQSITPDEVNKTKEKIVDFSHHLKNIMAFGSGK